MAMPSSHGKIKRAMTFMGAFSSPMAPHLPMSFPSINSRQGTNSTPQSPLSPMAMPSSHGWDIKRAMTFMGASSFPMAPPLRMSFPSIKSRQGANTTPQSPLFPMAMPSSHGMEIKRETLTFMGASSFLMAPPLWMSSSSIKSRQGANTTPQSPLSPIAMPSSHGLEINLELGIIMDASSFLMAPPLRMSFQ